MTLTMTNEAAKTKVAPKDTKGKAVPPAKAGGAKGKVGGAKVLPPWLNKAKK